MRLAAKYKLHHLETEDMMNDMERPKVEVSSMGKMMVLVNQVYLKKKPPYRLKTHQWNILLVNSNTVLTVMRRQNEIYDVRTSS